MAVAAGWETMLNVTAIARGRLLARASRVGEQGELFDAGASFRRESLLRAFDDVRGAFGHGVLVSGRALHLKGRLAEDRHGFVLRTPSLTQ